MRVGARRLGALLLVLSSAMPASAQTAPARLETLDVGFALYHDANHALFHDYWDPGAGIEAFVAVPFPLGRLRLGVQQFENAPVAAPIGFRSRYFHLGYDVTLHGAQQVRLRLGPEVGIYHMWFDDEGLPDFSRSESESAIGVGGGVDLFPATHWGVAAIARYQLVLTERRIHRVLLGASLSYRTGVPGWLRGFLD